MQAPHDDSRSYPNHPLIVALDLPSVADADQMVLALGDVVSAYKIGHHLAYRPGGIELARRLVAMGKELFLDLKLHDIESTVAAGARSAAEMGATFLTVHAYPKTMLAACEGRDRVAGSAVKILGVTVLTSYSDEDIAEAGYRLDIEETVRKRFYQARASGIDGVVCSARELEILIDLNKAGRRMLLVTPGIRLLGDPAGDQKRICTPKMAIAGGADHIVVGRPVVAAKDPVSAVRAIEDDMASA